MRPPILTIAVAAVAAGCLLPDVARAHPHHHVEQQAHITIGRDGAQLVLRIVPSIDQGSAMFDAIDGDRDGAVSGPEAAAFATQLIAAADLRLDGARLAFGEPIVTVPQRQLAAQGGGVIEVRAAATFLLDNRGHRLDFDISYPRFAPTWFVQPFYARSLLEASPSQRVERGEGSRVTVWVKL